MQEEMLVRWNWQKLKRLSKTARELRRLMLRRTSCVHPLNSNARDPSASCRHPRALDQRHCLGNSSGWPDQLKERLAGLYWRWIPYAASGMPLAREIEKAVAGAPETDVLILGNHGWSSADRIARQPRTSV